MAFLPLRPVAVAEPAAHAYDEWLDGIAAELDRPDCDRDELCRRVLTDLYFPHLRDAAAADLPAGARVALLQMDPRNVTLEPEYYQDVDQERFARVKPLLWLWEMFDKSPAGENIELGVRFRRMLAPHIFRRCGKNFKCFQFVKFSFGYNMEVGDNVVIHRHVLLDDRGGIRMGDRSSVADFANIYSHTHDIADQREVYTPMTVLGDGVRVTYHATILAGVHLADDAMVGAMALATRDVGSGEVAVGIPAKPRFRKPPAEERPAHPGTRDPLAQPDD
ncbi:MAG TPA: acyltransferase [Longimicrobiales bacterium]|nr:acyltransferase [Longimicrobiales bacterium]